MRSRVRRGKIKREGEKKGLAPKGKQDYEISEIGHRSKISLEGKKRAES